MTILEALSWGTEKIRASLHEKKLPEAHIPSQDAQLLLSHALDVRKIYLLANGDQELKDAQWDIYREYILRRAVHEPVSHILKSAEFFGREFYVNQHVLTPRPETEELVEYVLNHSQGTQAIVDIGTGSGVIAITVSLETQLPVYASDIDSQALTVAHHNADSLGAHVEFFQGDLLDAMPEEIQSLDFVTYIANLPYIPLRSQDSIDPDVLTYEPHHALFSGLDGLNHAEKLLRQLPHDKHFSLFLELDTENVELFAELASQIFPQSDMRVIKDLSKKPRFFELTHIPSSS